VCEINIEHEKTPPKEHEPGYQGSVKHLPPNNGMARKVRPLLVSCPLEGPWIQEQPDYQQYTRHAKLPEA
jgi:hypothetical protein